jgi:hypothetical protein
LNSYCYSNLYRADDSQPVNTETVFTNCHYDIIAKA